MTTIIGITRKVGREVKGQTVGDDIVKFRIRQVNRESLVEESVDFLTSEQGIAKALSVAKSFGFSFKDAGGILDEVLEQMIDFKSPDSFSSPRYVHIEGGQVGLLEYCGKDPDKEGRLYIQGLIEEQEVIIPALQSAENRGTPLFLCKEAIKKLTPFGNWGQFMVEGSMVKLLRRVD